MRYATRFANLHDEWGGGVDTAESHPSSHATPIWSGLRKNWTERTSDGTYIMVADAYRPPNLEILEKVEEVRYNIYAMRNEMRDKMVEVQDELKSMRKLLGLQFGVRDETDNFDMSVEDVKSLILKECKRGGRYYPGELAVEYGLDYDSVLEAVDSLKKEGHIKC